MSGTTLRTIVTLVLVFHGLGHIMGIIPALGLVNTESTNQDWLKNWSSYSWLLTDVLGDSGSRILCFGLFLIGLIGFIGAALGLYGWLVPHEWWRMLAIGSSMISLVTILLFWNALILLFPHKVGAIGVNLAILLFLLWINWPTEADIGY